MRRLTPGLAVRIVLAVGLVAIAVALGLVLSRPPLTVAGTNRVPANPAVAFTYGGHSQCQPGGTVPQGTSAVRISLSANTGPRVGLHISVGSTPLTQGSREAGWGVDETVTVPVARVPVTVSDTLLCVAVGPAVEAIQANGERVKGHGIWLRAEYMRPAGRSWLSLFSQIAHTFGLAHAPAGAWVVYLVIAAMLAVCAGGARVILRELG